MKRFIIILTAVIATLSVSTQEIKAQSQDLNVVVDSLSAKLEKLQHDFDFLDCKYKIESLTNSFKCTKNGINITLNSIDISVRYGFNWEYYLVLKENYESSIQELEVSKVAAENAKRNVRLIMLLSNFTEIEKDVLNSSMNLLDAVIEGLEVSLNSFKNYLDAYKSLE
ncbi:MAG: hypothetical protein U0K83_07445 [Bacteroidales bacterium]|nr:hypothetical protein [Bacteroidales bacterium]